MSSQVSQTTDHVSDVVSIATPRDSLQSGGGGFDAGSVIGSSLTAASAVLPLFLLKGGSKTKAPARRPAPQPVFQPHAASSPYTWPLIIGGVLVLGIGLIAMLSRE